MAFSDLQTTVLSSVFDTDRFGQTVTYAGLSVPAIIEYEDESSEQGGSVRTQAVIFVRSSDVSNPEYRDAVVIGSDTWRVRQIMSGAGGFWQLLIEESERPMI